VENQGENKGTNFAKDKASEREKVGRKSGEETTLSRKRKQEGRRVVEGLRTLSTLEGLEGRGKRANKT